jgi:hypothetical protein
MEAFNWQCWDIVTRAKPAIASNQGLSGAVVEVGMVCA